MQPKLLAGALVALAAAAAAGGAIADSSGSSPRQAFLSDAAGRLHVTPAQLQSALTGAYEDRLNAAVAAGRLTRSQADRIEARIAHGGTPWLHLGHARRGLHGALAPAAHYLGLTPDALRAELRSGSSLAQLAQARGKSVSGLEAAITAAVKARLDAAVAANRITTAREQQILSRLPQRLERLVNHAR